MCIAIDTRMLSCRSIHSAADIYEAALGRTAATTLDLRQAGAARRRPSVAAAQRETPESVPAPREGAQQGRTVLPVGGGGRLTTAAVHESRIRSGKQLPRSNGMRDALHRQLYRLSPEVWSSTTTELGGHTRANLIWSARILHADAQTAQKGYAASCSSPVPALRTHLHLACTGGATQSEDGEPQGRNHQPEHRGLTAAAPGAAYRELLSPPANMPHTRWLLQRRFAKCKPSRSVRQPVTVR